MWLTGGSSSHFLRVSHSERLPLGYLRRNTKHTCLPTEWERSENFAPQEQRVCTLPNWYRGEIRRPLRCESQRQLHPRSQPARAGLRSKHRAAERPRPINGSEATLEASSNASWLASRRNTGLDIGNSNPPFFFPSLFLSFLFFSIQRKSNCEKAFTQSVGKFHSCWQRVLQQSCPYPVASTDTAAWM